MKERTFGSRQGLMWALVFLLCFTSSVIWVPQAKGQDNSIVRLSGSDRYETMLQIALVNHSGVTKNVILASGLIFLMP